jgi:hypothetical protein
VYGSYAERGKPLRSVDTHYVLSGQTSPPSGYAWSRLGSAGGWKGQPFDDTVYRAYAREICPALVRSYVYGYLNLADRSIQRQNLGLESVRGHSTWHVREVLGFTLDFYIDAHSYRVRRLVLSGNIGTTWKQVFEYSRFNQPVAIVMPAGH